MTDDAKMNQRCIHAIISGRVHGVFFRANTQKLARELGVKGWVRNCADHTVELVAIGDVLPILQLIEWLHKGPAMAKVKEVWVEDYHPPKSYDDFLIEKDRL